jgi:hypothetical protein
MLPPHWPNYSLISACSLSYEKPSQAAGLFVGKSLWNIDMSLEKTNASSSL